MDGSTKKDYEFAGSTGSSFLNPDSDLSIFILVYFDGVTLEPETISERCGPAITCTLPEVV